MRQRAKDEKLLVMVCCLKLLADKIVTNDGMGCFKP